MSNGSYKYVGMTTQNLQKRFAQHKADARSGSCSLSNRLCQRRKPLDLQVLHTKLKKNEPGHTNTNPPRVARARGRVRPPAFTLLISLYITSDHPYLRVCYDGVYVCSLSLLIKRDF